MNVKYSQREYLTSVLHGTYLLRDVCVDDIMGRSIIVHADEDDYGLGGQDDSLQTGHSGARIACAIIGRTAC